MGKKQVDVFATDGLSLNLSGSADGRDGRDGRGISNTQTLWRQPSPLASSPLSIMCSCVTLCD